ncbi:MAG: aldehyde dehydrogenase [Rhodospirillales bacterium]|nr:aldehyde dehydrogenase [Rhodospirillales bacterium]
MADKQATLGRRDVVSRILADREDALVITGLGSATWDTAAAGDNPLNFYLWGGMGGAAVMGLGLALAQPDRRVLVITGDGEMMMGLGALATIAVAAPSNFAVMVIDNERYGETGMQEGHTGAGVDLGGMAAAAGWPKTTIAWTEEEVNALAPILFKEPGPIFATVKVNRDPVPLVLPARDGTALRARFREALLGEKATE